MPFRCAFGCISKTGTVLHVFPHPTRRHEYFKIWLDMVGGKPETMSDIDFFKKKRVCTIHFEDRYRNRNNRLSAIAVPTLYLPIGVPLPKEVTGCTQPAISSSPDIKPVLPLPKEVTGCTQPAISSSPDIESGVPLPKEVTGCTQPAISSSPDIKSGVPLPKEVTGCTQPAISSSPDIKSVLPLPKEVAGCTQPAISSSPDIKPGVQVSKEVVEDVQSDILHTSPDNTISVTKERIIKPPDLIKEHNYCINSKPTNTNVLPEGYPTIVSLHRHTEINPLRKKIRSLGSELCRVRKRYLVLKQRMASANQAMKIKQKAQTHKKKGFTILEKVLSITLFKENPECYRLLSERFALPSPTGITRLKRRLKNTHNIDPKLFEIL